jgi:acyl-CoA synthetase (AMP-forming)/AMP-acid ligase II
MAVRESSARGRSRSLTWYELCGAASRLAGELRRGSAPPVLLLSAPNCLEQLVALIAGLWCDGTVVVLPPDLPAVRFREIARNCAVTTALVGENAISGLVAEGVHAVPIEAVSLEAIAEPLSAQRAGVPGAGGSLVLLTSGTTGAPKLVRRTASALDAVGQGCARAMGLGPEDAMLVAIPLHHSFGIDLGLLTAVSAGCRLELHDRFVSQRVLSALRHQGVTALPAVPYLFDLLARSVRPGDRPAPTLRLAISAGALLPRAVFDEFRARFQVSIGQIYGAPEFGSVTYSNPGAAGFRPDTVGRPLHGVEIRILAPKAPSPARGLPRGAEGLVAVAAPSMFQGYLGEAASPLIDGFFVTGDIGRLDDGDRLELTGRLALLIDVGGRKVNPFEVEAALETHPAVQAAAVVPVPYSRTVTRLKAIIVPGRNRSPSSQELRSYLREQLEEYKIPRSFELRDALPRSPTGKLLRQQLSAGAGSTSPRHPRLAEQGAKPS